MKQVPALSQHTVQFDIEFTPVQVPCQRKRRWVMYETCKASSLKLIDDLVTITKFLGDAGIIEKRLRPGIVLGNNQCDQIDFDRGNLPGVFGSFNNRVAQTRCRIQHMTG